MGKGIMFMVWMWIIISLAGGVSQGMTVSVATTSLTADLTAVGTTLNVRSTQGFPETGFVQILDERIAYSGTTANTFHGSTVNPLVRGSNDTEAIAHASGEKVRTIESSMLNQSLGYKLAVMSDSSGLIAFVTIPFAFITLIITFFTLPLGFLGTDLEILTYLWAVISIGIIVALGVSLAGGRKVA